MKMNFKSAALIAVLSLAAAGCQKENVSDPAESVAPITMRIVTYNVDGVTTQVTLLGDEAWQDFLNWMFALAEEGHRVSFAQGNTLQYGEKKEVITYTTQNYNDAQDWANKKVAEGYTVSILYNKEEGSYTCIAEK